MIINTGERTIPWNIACALGTLPLHVMRYAWSLRFVAHRTVVDLCCGTGYGSYLMSMAAERVIGIDIDEETILFAEECFEVSNLSFICKDVLEITIRPEVYVAFECLEHLDDPGELINKTRGRMLLWSVPVGDDSKYHKRAYTAAELETFIPDSELWFQSAKNEIAMKENATFEPAYVLGMRSVL